MNANYDLDRAARAGGFADDLATGRECARRLYRAVRQNGTEGADAVPLVEKVVEDIAADWGINDMPEEERGGPLAALFNTISQIMLDLNAQVSEAREASRA